MSFNRIRTAIWGKSPISFNVASDIIKLDKIQLTTLAIHNTSNNAISLNETKSFADKFGLTKIYGINELVADKEIDLVYIASPNLAHAHLAITLMKAGKHVIVEKPMATTETEVSEIINAAKENNRFCMEALMYQCHPSTEHLLNLSEKYLGKLTRIIARYGSNIYDRENPIQGGAIRNMGCYPLSLARLLAKSEPHKMITCSGIMDEKNERDTYARISLAFEEGLIADIETSSVNKFYELTLECENGRKILAKTNPWMQNEKCLFELIDPKGQQVLTESEASFIAKQKLYAYEFDVAVDHIQRGEFSPLRPGVTWEHSLGNVKIIEQWFNQVKQQQELTPSSRTMSSIFKAQINQTIENTEKYAVSKPRF